MKTRVQIERYHLILFVALVLLSACTGYHPAPESTPYELPRGFSLAGGQRQPSCWWQTFKDKELERLEQQALSENLDLKAALARLRKAQAEAKQAGAELYPWLDINMGATHNTSRNLGQYSNEDVISLGAIASYEVDLWGRLRKMKKAATLEVSASKSDLDAARITVASELALTYFDLQALDLQLDIIDRQIKDNKVSLDIVTSMYEYGQTDILDTLQQEQAVEATIAQQIEKQMNLKILENQLAILMGKPPQTVEIKMLKGLPTLPPLPKSGLPIELVNRRPDCKSAFFKLRAANARLAQAVAEQYPRLSLTASANSDASRVNDLFENWIASLAASMLTPVFEGRRLEAQVEKKEAEAWQALYDYSKIVLGALKEVEDALAQEIHQRQLVKNMEKRFELSRKSLEQVKEQYKAGTVEFLRFLATELNTDSLEIQLVTERLKLIKYRIALYRALAGPIPTTGYPYENRNQQGSWR